jgi:UDP-N-acetylmuramyl pentapeptide phosphotransferase/UDP-N-acetylglucosamine-1-phosphate transferase
MNKSVGLILTIVGLIIMIWGAYGFKTREKVLDIGPIEATKEKTHRLPYAPVMGGIIFVGGIAVLVSARH